MGVGRLRRMVSCFYFWCARRQIFWMSVCVINLNWRAEDLL